MSLTEAVDGAFSGLPETRPLHIVLVSYACDPSLGTEPGLGWAWAEALAERGHTVELLTHPLGDKLQHIAQRTREIGPVGQRIRLHAIHPPRLRWTRRFPAAIRKQLWEFLCYEGWQRRALAHARRQGLATADLVHHVTYSSLPGGCALHRLGPPLVFGPVGGGQTAPQGYRQYLGAGYRAEMMRELLWVRWLSRRPSCMATLRTAALVLVTNRDTMRLARRLGRADAQLMLADGIPDALVREPSSAGEPGRHERPPTVLWVGGLIPRKAPALALRAFALLTAKVPDARLEVVGDGPLRAELERLAASLGVARSVRFRGRLPWKQSLAAYDTADVLLFTSLRDAFGVQSLEAWARGLPVVHLDHQGVGDFSAPGGAVPVPLGDPDDLPRCLAEALRHVLTDPQAQADMAEAGIRWARQHTWSAKAELAERLYLSALGTARGRVHSMATETPEQTSL